MQSSSVQIRVSDMIFVLKKRWKMLLSLTMTGLVFGLLLLAVTYIQNSQQSYVAGGSFAISTRNAEGVYVNGAQIANNNDFHLAEDMADAVRYVVSSDHVLNQVIADQGLLGVTPEELRTKLTLTQYQATQIMEMRFTWNNAENAVSIWRSIVDTASSVMPSTLQIGQLAIINEPKAEQVGTSSASRLLPVILSMLGFCCGIGFAVIELIIRPTLNNAKDAETMFGLETIGIIPRDDAYFRRHQRSILVSDENERSVVLQNYSAAAYILRNRLGSKEQHHCFYVTSSAAGEGKSTVAANLAIQLSDMEHKTLLIDFDMRNPSLGTLFMEKVDYAHSLNALYRNEATEEDAITTLTGYLDLLPAVLEHNAMAMDGTITELIQRLREKYEYIILDSAPVGEASETLSLNRVANTVLFVIAYDSTPLPLIQNSLEKLDKSGIRVLGCVVNAAGERGRKNTRKDNMAPAHSDYAGSSAKPPKAPKPPKPKKTKKRKKQNMSPAEEPQRVTEAPAPLLDLDPDPVQPASPAPQAPEPSKQKQAEESYENNRDVLSELMAEETAGAEKESPRLSDSSIEDLLRMFEDDSQNEGTKNEGTGEE